MSRKAVRYPAALALAALSGWPSGVLAQNAVGDGRALERPLQTFQPGAMQAPRTGFGQELLFREAIVAGQAPAGLSFRGDALPSRFEFRGELGDDALFAYRRDSLYSGLAGRGIRGTEALQYQFALTTGGQVPSTLAGRLSYARAGEAERGDSPYQPLERVIEIEHDGLRRVTPESDLIIPPVESGSSIISSMIQPVRSVSAYTANRSFQPTLVGVMQNRVTQQAAGQTASPLMGVQNVPVDDLRDPTQPPAGPIPQPVTDTPTAPTVTAYDELLLRLRDMTPADPLAQDPGTATPGVTTPGVTNPGVTQPGVTIPGVTTPGAADPDSATQPGIVPPGALQGGAVPQARSQMPTWAQDIVTIRRILRGLPPSTAQALGLDPELAEAPEVQDPNLLRDLDADAPLKLEPATPADPATFREDVLRRIREAGGIADSLIATKQPQIDRYSVYMRGAEELLAQERYFDAEERFISAMTARPNDVNASIGRAHAQMGAGLFLSAGLNLRQLLVNHPEIAGMRYGPRLLPSAARMTELKGLLREGLQSPTAGADSGLLLAYIGFQTESPEDMRIGLAALEGKGDEADQRLAEMLRGVWLAEPAPGAEQPPAAPAAPEEGGE